MIRAGTLNLTPPPRRESLKPDRCLGKPHSPCNAPSAKRMNSTAGNNHGALPGPRPVTKIAPPRPPRPSEDPILPGRAQYRMFVDHTQLSKPPAQAQTFRTRSEKRAPPITVSMQKPLPPLPVSSVIPRGYRALRTCFHPFRRTYPRARFRQGYKRSKNRINCEKKKAGLKTVLASVKNKSKTTLQNIHNSARCGMRQSRSPTPDFF